MAYVDDFKMAGKAENHQKAWDLICLDENNPTKKLGLELDPSTPLGKYLGCGQRDVKVDDKIMKDKRELYNSLFETANKIDVDAQANREKFSAFLAHLGWGTIDPLEPQNHGKAASDFTTED